MKWIILLLLILTFASGASSENFAINSLVVSSPVAFGIEPLIGF